MSKIPQMIYFDEDSFIDLYNFKKEKQVKNLSQAINLLIKEHKRFRIIAMKLQKQIEDQSKEVKTDEVKSKD